MYRLYQDNLNPRPDEEDDRAVEPVPAPFYGDDYIDHDIPLQVNVPIMGDEPSALGDGSAMAPHRDFEDLWRLLEAEALRNGWRHILPAEVAEDDNDEDQITEWGINSVPPVIHDALVNEPDVPIRNRSTNDARDIRSSFESSNNETTLHSNHGAMETCEGNRGFGRACRQSSSGLDCENSIPARSGNNNVADDETIPPLGDRAQRVAPEDDPGPPLAPVARSYTPPRRVEDEWQALPISLTEKRAKYISAGIIKRSKNTYLGIELKGNRDGTIEIERIASDGYIFVSGTPLKVGDRITGIKTSKATYACGHVGGMRKNDVLRVLKKSLGRITIVAENPTGDPERIECMTSKPHPEFGTGIFFLSGSPGSNILQIHSVPANGLFANSLLHRGARVISINGVDCSELDACVATDIVKSAPRYVSIVAHTTRLSSVDDSLNPGAHLRSVPEVSEERRTSFGIFRRRENNSCSVDC